MAWINDFSNTLKLVRGIDKPLKGIVIIQKPRIALLSFIISVLQPFKWLLVGQVVVAVVWAIEISLRPYLIKVILNKLSGITPTGAFEELLPPIFCYIFMVVLFVAVFRFHEWIILHLQPNLKKNIRITLMNLMMNHSHSLYQNHFSGSLANKINDVANGIPNILNTFIDQFFSHILALLIAVYTVWFVDPKFAIGLICWGALFLTISLKMSAKAKTLSKEAAEVHSTAVGHIVDILGSMINVRLFGGKGSETKYLNKTFQASVQTDQKRDRLFMKIHTFQEVSFIFFQLVCFYLLILGIKNQTVTPGDFALILILNISIVTCLKIISRDIRNFAEFLGNITQGLNIILSPVEIKDKVGAKNLIIVKKEILFENVQFYYEGSGPLFENKSVRIHPGQKVGLVGYSGSGKSTFINLILRLFDVKQGRILIDNQDIRDVTQDSLRQSIAMIPQDPLLFHRTLMENIRYGRMDASDEEVIESAKRAHAHEFICELPHAYQSLVGERGVKLSGGERQRIAIARAFLKNAPILIFDEATSQLDSIIESLIQKSLWDLMRGKTSIVIAHRLSTLLHMDRILVFDKGKIVQDGAHLDLMAEQGIYKTLWDTQFGGFSSGGLNLDIPLSVA